MRATYHAGYQIYSPCRISHECTYIYAVPEYLLTIRAPCTFPMKEKRETEMQERERESERDAKGRNRAFRNPNFFAQLAIKIFDIYSTLRLQCIRKLRLIENCLPRRILTAFDLTLTFIHIACNMNTRNLFHFLIGAQYYYYWALN